MNIRRATVEHTPPKVWSAEESARLTTFWTEGMYLSELARRFHCSKQAIRRQVGVLGLAPRPGPIQTRRAKPKPAKPLPRSASTLPPLPSQQETADV